MSIDFREWEEWEEMKNEKLQFCLQIFNALELVSTHRYFQLDVLRCRFLADEILQYCNCGNVVALEFRLTSEVAIGI
jgi:hypothetical protein